MRRLFQLFFLLMPFAGWAQNVTGVWQGHFRSTNVAARSSIFDDRYRFEVQIAQTNKHFEAVTYSYLSSIFYGKASAAGTVNAHTGKVMLQEGKLLELRNQSGDVCIMTCFLQYSKSGDDEFLEGTYVSMNVRDSSNCGRGTVFLRKVASSDFYVEPFLAKKEKEIAEKEGTATMKPKSSPAHKDSSLAKTTTPHRNGTTTKPGVKTAPPIAKTTAPAAGTKPPASKLPPPVAGTRAPGAKPTSPATKPGSPVIKTAPPVAKIAPPKTSRPEKQEPSTSRVTVPNATVHQPPGTDSNGMGRKFPTITPRILLTRSNQVVKTITVNVNEVTLNIYDDGAIDHDTISVYLDNKQVISHAMLTDRPLILTLHLDESNDYHELVMVAENEGEIPPNTSLMIVKAGDKEYEVRITSTEQKNAVVTFKYVK
jgi:hypothetical protein